MTLYTLSAYMWKVRGRLEKYPELTYVPSLRLDGVSQLDKYLDRWAAAGVGDILEADALFEVQYCSLANGLLRERHFHSTGSYVIIYDVGI